MSEQHVLITPRRNFLVRALGIMAGGATVSVPIIVMDDAGARITHHVKGLHAAMLDYYVGLDVTCRCTGDPWSSAEYVRKYQYPAVYQFEACPPVPPDLRPVYKGWREYDMARGRGIVS